MINKVCSILFIILILLSLVSCASDSPTETETDFQPPTVEFSNLNNNDSISGTYNIVINAYDNIGVTLVELLVNDLVVGSDYNSPYNIEFNCNNYSDDYQVFSARARDAAGNIGVSNVLLVSTEYDFAPNSDGKIKISITDYHELDSFDLGSNGDPFFVFTIEIDDTIFATQTTMVYENDSYIPGPISLTCNIPDNCREYKFTIEAWDEDLTSSNDPLDYSPSASGYWYQWTLIPVVGDFTSTYSGESDNVPGDFDCEITVQVETLN